MTGGARITAAGSGLLVALLSGLPVVRGGPVPVFVGLAAAALLGLLGAASAVLAIGRTLLALAVAGWIGVCVALGSGSPDLLVLGTAPALRLWAGLPELVRLGKPGLPDLVTDVVGGTAAAALVLLVARGADDLRPSALLLSAAAGGLLVGTGLLRLRRQPRPSGDGRHPGRV